MDFTANPVLELPNNEVPGISNHSLYNHTCYEVDLSQPECGLFLFIVNTVIMGFFIIVGICGNTFTLITLFPDSKVNVTSLLLVVLACCDSLFLISQLMFKSLTGMCRFLSSNVMCSYELYVWPYVNFYVRPFAFAMVISSIWVTLLVTVHRAVAILIPHKAKSYATVKSVRIQCVFLICGAILLVIPKFFEFYLITDESCPPGIFYTKLSINPIYGVLYRNIIMNIFVNIGPLFVLIILTYFLVREIHHTIRQNKKLRGKPSQNQKYGTQLTIILILVVVVFIICEIPHVIYILARAVTKDKFQMHFSCGRPWFYFFHITEMLIILNASINFFLYCLAGARFRKMLKSTFCGTVGQRFQKQSTTTRSSKPTGFTPLTTFSVANGE